MIFMFDGSGSIDEIEADMGFECEQLFTPLTRYSPKRIDGRFAIDNGGFSRFERNNFLSLLEREKPRKHLCRWVALPDVVADARRTMECFVRWRDLAIDWPLALVAQDGIEHLDIPWDDIECIFIGGSTKWKLSEEAAACVKAAKILNKWVHVGRVNTPDRLDYFEKLGADSFDGSGLSRFWKAKKPIFDYHKNQGQLAYEMDN